jgi:hypothetical protein
MPATNVVASEGHTRREVMVWIEDGEGAIARGVAESVTAAGARVRLAERPGFVQGAEVALRLCFERGAPTVAATARVASLQGEGAAVECGLEWTASPQQRGEIEAWLKAA